MRVRSWVYGVLVLAGGLGDLPVHAAPAEPEDLRPGLLARYRSLSDSEATLTRLDPKPAFRLDHSSLHPRIPPGPFEATWSGMLVVNDEGPIRFEAYVLGELTVEVDGVVVLQGRGEQEATRLAGKQTLAREPGSYPLKIRYRSLPRGPARLQLWWQGPTFAPEPLPAWHLKHLPADLPEALAGEQAAQKGRAAAEQLGCARCHARAFPGIDAPAPGPSLADIGGRLSRAWLLDWLEDPAKVRPGAHMPALFGADRAGFVERWLVAEYLLGPAAAERPQAQEKAGDHRMGRRSFVSVGCSACHFLPDVDRAEQPDLDRTVLTGLADRLPARELAAFLANPHARYPDGRMPRLPLSPEMARDIAAYLLLWSKPAATSDVKAPTAEEINQAARRLGVRGTREAGAALVKQKRCGQCHPGLGEGPPADVPVNVSDHRRGCLSGKSLPHFKVSEPTRKALVAYQAVAPRENHPSPFAARQRLLAHLGCVRCHQRDSDRVPALEAAGSTLGGAWLQNVPFQRTPRLSYPHQKYTATHLLSAVREGVSGLRPARYSYRMPAFGRDAETVVQALAEGDGELAAATDPKPGPADPTLGPLDGPRLAGFEGYGCVSCHVWAGRQFAEPDPGAIGTDLTRLSGRVRRDWFDRFLEGPARSHPGTPMPRVFERGKPAQLRSVQDGDAGKQKEALWSYFALGDKAPAPKPPPPLAIAAPDADEPPLVAQVPVRLPDGPVVEALCLLYGSHDLLVYDLGAGTLHSAYTGARILRGVQGRIRTYTVSGTPPGTGFGADPPLRLTGPGKPEAPVARTLQGYDRRADGARLRWQVSFPSGDVELTETLRLEKDPDGRRLVRAVRFVGVPAGRSLELLSRGAAEVKAEAGKATGAAADGVFRVVLVPDDQRTAAASVRLALPGAKAPAATRRPPQFDPDRIEGSLTRPGYRAIAYPRPKTDTGEDRVMPGAVAVHPKDGRVFIASLKTGELFVLRDPTGDGKRARFDDYARGLFQDCFAMKAESDALYVLHRRNLTRVTDADGDGRADRFDRVAALAHGVAETYDYAYGLVRDPTGAFVLSFAPYANGHLPGSGSALRLVPGKKPREIGFGFRNPLGWSSGPGGEVFFTDNQGEWVATNKLCHLGEGRYHGFPHPARRGEHAGKTAAPPAVWVPYAWARSINGVTFDDTGGKFGPFAGQFFLAELMFGGAIVRADVEKVNGVYQGACFPFWGRGLLGPVTLAFDPKGRLWVGGITEPGWMAQPDRGALFRIDHTGEVPFEIRSIKVLPRGFRLVFTAPVSAATAREAASYRIEHYRYEYTGSYGSPELDRTAVPVERVEPAQGGKSVDLITAPLVKDRVYLIGARGVRSAKGESLVHPAGAYTLNEIPATKR